VTTLPIVPAATTRRRRIAAGLLLAGALGAAGFLALFAPFYRGLAIYGLYAIPSHLLVSFLANEPMLFAAARDYPPPIVALTGTLGCIVAIVLDYALIGWFVTRRLVRAELEDSKAVRIARRLFGKAPFLLIVASAALPVPFYPAKILAIVADYPLRRFIPALILGRFPRFWFLAIVGDRLEASNSALGSFGLALGLIAGWGLWRTVRRNRRRNPETGSSDPAHRRP
jgi:membrane protein YqaA with SNARE-associated domain